MVCSTIVVIDRDVSTHAAVMVGRFTERNFNEHSDYLRLVHYEPHPCLHAVLALLVTIPLFLLKMYRKGVPLGPIRNKITKIRKGLVIF